jgi:hypothetical protein
MTGAANHQRRLDDQPIEIEALKRLIRRSLGCAYLRFRTDGRKVNQRAFLRGAGLEQSDCRLLVNAVCFVGTGGLKDTDTIHHGVDPRQAGTPNGRIHVSVEIASDPIDVRDQPAAKRDVAAAAYDIESLSSKRPHDLRADEAVSTG